MDLPTAVFLLLALAGLALLVAGVYVLLGLGFALLAGGAAALLVAAFVRRGLAAVKEPAGG